MVESISVGVRRFPSRGGDTTSASAAEVLSNGIHPGSRPSSVTGDARWELELERARRKSRAVHGWAAIHQRASSQISRAPGPRLSHVAASRRLKTFAVWRVSVFGGEGSVARPSVGEMIVARCSTRRCVASAKGKRDGRASATGCGNARRATPFFVRGSGPREQCPCVARQSVAEVEEPSRGRAATLRELRWPPKIQRSPRHARVAG